MNNDNIYIYILLKKHLIRISYFVLRVSCFVFRTSYFVLCTSYFVFRITYNVAEASLGQVSGPYRIAQRVLDSAWPFPICLRQLFHKGVFEGSLAHFGFLWAHLTSCWCRVGSLLVPLGVLLAPLG